MKEKFGENKEKIRLIKEIVENTEKAKRLKTKLEEAVKAEESETKNKNKYDKISWYRYSRITTTTPIVENRRSNLFLEWASNFSNVFINKIRPFFDGLLYLPRKFFDLLFNPFYSFYINLRDDSI